MSDDEKKHSVTRMFNTISKEYVFLNSILTFGIDKWWRKKFVANFSNQHYSQIVDLASGTGDIAKLLLKLNHDQIYAVDPAEKMLEIAKNRLADSKGNIDFFVGSAEKLPFIDNSIDLVTISFGIRNFSDLDQSMKEVFRVLKPGGMCAIMEFSMPTNKVLKLFYLIYLKIVVPIIGRIFSRSKEAYRYLRSSILSFSKNIDVLDKLKFAGFRSTEYKSLTGSIVKCYIAEK